MIEKINISKALSQSSSFSYLSGSCKNFRHFEKKTPKKSNITSSITRMIETIELTERRIENDTYIGIWKLTYKYVFTIVQSFMFFS